jgi:hypothetical protein
MLDWQISKYSSPICDLSYFLFACISKEDIEELDEILRLYHKSLTSHLSKMGADSSTLYPLNTFLEDWKKYCRFGVAMSSMLFKICATDSDEVIDIAHAAENGGILVKPFHTMLKTRPVLRIKHYIL